MVAQHSMVTIISSIYSIEVCSSNYKSVIRVPLVSAWMGGCLFYTTCLPRGVATSLSFQGNLSTLGKENFNCREIYLIIYCHFHCPRSAMLLEWDCSQTGASSHGWSELASMGIN